MICGGRVVALLPCSGAETRDMQGVAESVVSRDATIASSLNVNAVNTVLETGWYLLARLGSGREKEAGQFLRALAASQG